MSKTLLSVVAAAALFSGEAICDEDPIQGAPPEGRWMLRNGQPQIFVDDVRLARKSGVVRRVHAGTKLPQPVLAPEKPWEAHRIYVYGTVLYDEPADGFRMWYMASGTALKRPQRDARLDHSVMDLVLYATSDDGVRWQRPDLGLYTFDGSASNNIVYDYHTPSILFDPGASSPEGRYKMLGCGTVHGQRGYVLAHSPDGLHWQDYAHNPVVPGSDTCTLAHDPETGTYLAFHKRYIEHRGHRRRLVFLSTSSDLRIWSDPVLVMAPDETDDVQTQREGGLYSQFYNMSAFPCAGQFLGMVTHFRYTGPPPEKGPQQSNDDGPIDVQLVHSRDGRTWYRLEDRAPVIPNGPHAYDAGCILGVANQPVVVGDECWLYYTGITTTHGGYLPKKKITIARASWRREGFVSLDANDQGGSVETAVFAPPGGELLVNADASRGEIAVEVLDARGDPLPGYTHQAARPLTTDAVRHPVRWANRDTVPADNPIRLRFYVRKASLFSYVFE